MKLKEKALIKDLELQIDYLVGYSPTGEHWKKEYYIRQQLIDATLIDSQTPPEVRDKINRLQEQLWKMRNKEDHDQGYLNYAAVTEKTEKQIAIHDYHERINLTSPIYALDQDLMDKRPYPSGFDGYEYY